MQEGNLTPVKSVLKIDKVVFDDLSFHRFGFESNDRSVSTELGIAKHVKKLSNGYYRVSVKATVTRKEEYEASVQISGFCYIDESLENKDELLNANAVSILFAYVRSQLTLLTAQPGMSPVVLPVMNVAEMIKNGEKPSTK